MATTNDVLNSIDKLGVEIEKSMKMLNVCGKNLGECRGLLDELARGNGPEALSPSQVAGLQLRARQLLVRQGCPGWKGEGS